MGRAKINASIITDINKRKLCFKKRRIGLIKKAMQLSKLSNCEISLKIFWKEDGSLVEYLSDFKNDDVIKLEPMSKDVKLHAMFHTN
jgi:hypothetical protein